jgi:UDP-glucose 4-epimerase
MHHGYNFFCMKILITGPYGYLGGRITDFLYKNGHELTLVSRYIKEDTDFHENVKFKQINWDVSDCLLEICYDIDLIIHTSGINSVECEKNPLLALQHNGLTTTRLLDAAIRSKVKTFIYLSTIHTYGTDLDYIITEKSCCTNIHPYASSHKIAEENLLYAHSKGLINSIIFRISNVFGAPLDKNVNCWDLYVNSICKQLVTENKICIKSKFNTRKNFIPINTFLNILNNFIFINFEKNKNTLFNIGYEYSISLLEMAELINKVYNKNLRIENNFVSNEIINPNFDFRINKIIDNNLYTSTNMEEEIINLLIFCRQNYFNEG